MSTAPTLSALDLLRQRHQEIANLFAHTLESTGEEKSAAFDCLRATIAAHEVVEEMFVHPLAREMNGEAERIVIARLEEEAEGAQKLSELENLGVEADEFEPLLLQFRQAVTAHAQAEESELFPILQASLSEADLEALADSIIVSEQLAPTHAHPHASQNPTALMLTGPFVAMLDKARDHLRKLRND